jgi:hypothetical protein
VFARTISELIDRDLHRIEPADPYPASYDATAERNVREQNDTVLLASPIWNVRPPMIMTTIIEATTSPAKPSTLRHLRRQWPRPHRRDLHRRPLNPGLAVLGEEVARQCGDVETGPPGRTAQQLTNPSSTRTGTINPG